MSNQPSKRPAVKDSVMRKCWNTCSLLLFASICLLMMQLAVSLHHHKSKSYHDDEDSLHSFTSDASHNHLKQAAWHLPDCRYPVNSPSNPTNLSSKSNCSLQAELFAKPSQSRAPPVIT